MRYIAANPCGGRIGHQMSVVWQARFFAECFGLQYVHAPFVSRGPTRLGWAAQWNEFFGLGHGEAALDVVQNNRSRIIHDFGPDPLSRFDLTFVDWARMIDGVPDEYLLAFADVAWLKSDDIFSWQQQGFVPPDSFARTVAWFQRQTFRAPFYQTVPLAPYPDGTLRVAAYWRNLAADETQMDIFRRPLADILGAVHALQLAYPERRVHTRLYTQCVPDGTILPHEDFDVVVLDDVYPDTFSAMKTLFEADVAITTGGGSALLVGLYRANRKPTIADPTWFFSGVKNAAPGELLCLPQDFLTNAWTA